MLKTKSNLSIIFIAMFCLSLNAFPTLLSAENEEKGKKFETKKQKRIETLKKRKDAWSNFYQNINSVNEEAYKARREIIKKYQQEEIKLKESEINDLESASSNDELKTITQKYKERMKELKQKKKQEFNEHKEKFKAKRKEVMEKRKQELRN